MGGRQKVCCRPRRCHHLATTDTERAVGSAIALLVVYRDNGYTTAAMCATLLAAIVVASSRLVFTRRFWVFQLALFGIFVLANWFLTALPVITYGEASIIGTRILTIPVEDFFFNFAFVNLFLVTFNWLDTRTARLTK